MACNELYGLEIKKLCLVTIKWKGNAKQWSAAAYSYYFISIYAKYIVCSSSHKIHFRYISTEIRLYRKSRYFFPFLMSQAIAEAETKLAWNTKLTSVITINSNQQILKPRHQQVENSSRQCGKLETMPFIYTAIDYLEKWYRL